LGGNLGAFNGDLIVASEGSNTIRAINPTTHVVSTVVVAPQIGGTEELSVVPLDLGSGDPALEGMYGANYSLNVVKADASQFAGLQGDIVVTGEFGHGVFDVHFDETNYVVGQVGTFPNQPEDGIFVTSAIIRGGGVPEPGSLLLLGTAIAGLAAWRVRNRTEKNPS
jgi:PEP-CTERM motif